MAETIITGSPASVQMMCDVDAGRLSPKWQMFEFSFDGLGANPNIQSASLSATATGDEVVAFTARCISNLQTYNFGADEAADIPVKVIQDTLGDGRIKFSIAYYGKPKTDRHTATATVTFSLTVVTSVPVVTDTRSTGVLSASSVSFGGSISMTITPMEEYAATYTHTVTWSVGNFQSTTQLAAGVTSASFTVPTAWMSEVPAATSGTLRAILDTLSDGTSVGTREYKAKANVPSSVKPTVGSLTASAVNTGELADNTRQFFAGASRVALTLSSAAAGTGSSIASIVYSGWGDSITDTQLSVTTGILQTAGTFEIQAVVTDRRGRTATSTVQITVDQYSPPYFTALSWIRCQTDGTPDDKGNAVIVNATFGCSTDILDHNTATASVALRAKGSPSWSAEVSRVSGQDTLITVMELLTTVSYEMRFTVTDRAMSVARYAAIPSSRFLFHFSNNGQSIGVGQAAEALAEGETGRVTFNPEWSVYLGQDIHIGSQTLEEYIQSIVTAMQGS